MKKFLCMLSMGLCIGLYVLTNAAVGADTINIYNINDNSSNSGYRNSDIMCTRYNGFCANNNYIMSSSRTVYAPSRWKRQTLREKRLSYQNSKYNSYEY